MILAIDFLFLA